MYEATYVATDMHILLATDECILQKDPHACTNIHLILTSISLSSDKMKHEM